MIVTGNPSLQHICSQAWQPKQRPATALDTPTPISGHTWNLHPHFCISTHIRPWPFSEAPSDNELHQLPKTRGCAQVVSCCLAGSRMRSALRAVFCLLFAVSSLEFIQLSVNVWKAEHKIPVTRNTSALMALQAQAKPGAHGSRANRVSRMLEGGYVSRGEAAWQNTQGVKFNCETAFSHSAYICHLLQEGESKQIGSLS